MRAVAVSVGTLKMGRNIRNERLGQIFRQPTVRVFIRESDRLWSAHPYSGLDLRNYHLFDGILT